MKKCIHFWRIDDQSYGVCIKCGTGKQFPHDIEQRTVNYDKIHEHARRGAAHSTKNKGKKRK